MCISANANKLNWMDFRLFFDTVSVFRLYSIKCNYIIFINEEYMDI